MKFRKIEYIERKSGEIKIEKVPGEGFMKFLYYHPFGKLPLEALVKRKFLSSMYGRLMDCKNSKNKIKSFVQDFEIDMDESIKTIDEFESFNDFFVRKLKPECRIISSGDTVASPADGKIIAFNNLKEKDRYFVKGEEFNLKEFFNDDELAKKYVDGTFMIIRLAPVDYHRFHFPLNGVIGDSKIIDGAYYSVSPYAIRKNFRIFCENKREYSELKTEKFGDVILSEIGATMVGGIKQTYSPGTKIKKGDEKGYFYFGGSSCVLLFEKDKIKIDKDILLNSLNGIETQIKMGEQIGRINN